MMENDGEVDEMWRKGDSWEVLTEHLSGEVSKLLAKVYLPEKFQISNGQIEFEAGSVSTIVGVW